MGTKFVIIESPYAGKNPTHYRRNIAYLRAAILDCLKRGETPFASHGFYPGALDDTIPEQRKLGIDAGFQTAELFHALGGKRVYYIDRGQSTGIRYGLEHAQHIGQEVEERSLGAEWNIENDPQHCEHAGTVIPDQPGCDDGVCKVCGTVFRAVVLPEDAIQVALEYLRKKA